MKLLLLCASLVVCQAPPAPVTTAPPPPPPATTQVVPVPVPTTVVVVVPTTVVAVTRTTTQSVPSAIFTPNTNTRTFSPNPTTTNGLEEQQSKGGLSTGLIVGIVIGALILCFGLISYGVNVFQKKKSNDSTLLEMTGTNDRHGANSGATKLFGNVGVLGAVNHARKEEPLQQQYYAGSQAGNNSQNGGSQVGGYNPNPSFNQGFVAPMQYNQDGSYNQYYSQQYYDQNQQQHYGEDGYYGEYTPEEIEEWNRQQAEYQANPDYQQQSWPVTGDKPLPKPK